MGIIPSGRHAVLDGADAIVFERTFAAPIDDVWAAITESGRLARWIGHYTGDPADGYVMLTMNVEDEPMPHDRLESRDRAVCVAAGPADGAAAGPAPAGGPTGTFAARIGGIPSISTKSVRSGPCRPAQVESDRRPDGQVADNLVRRWARRDVSDVRLAALLTRPGSGGISYTDRAWARLLTDAADRHRIRFEPVFRAHDEMLVEVPTS